MIDGRPAILVVGAADTGRAPLLAALLRRELSGLVAVSSAGVLGHAGEPASMQVQLVLEQFGLTVGAHMARQLDAESIRGADLLLAVDRGTAYVARSRTQVPVLALSDLAQAEDLPDPHRMPLGVWVATAQAYKAQLALGLPAIRARLQVDAVRPTAPEIPLRPAPAAAPTPTTSPPLATGDRADHIARLSRLLETAQVLPEIIDWTRLVQEATERLQALAALAGPGDFTPAATAMLLGVMAQASRTPDEQQIGRLLRGISRLAAPVDAAMLAEIGTEISLRSG